MEKQAWYKARQPEIASQAALTTARVTTENVPWLKRYSTAATRIPQGG